MFVRQFVRNQCTGISIEGVTLLSKEVADFLFQRMARSTRKCTNMK
jgi:hypothetical protein